MTIAEMLGYTLKRGAHIVFDVEREGELRMILTVEGKKYHCSMQTPKNDIEKMLLNDVLTREFGNIVRQRCS